MSPAEVGLASRHRGDSHPSTRAMQMRFQSGLWPSRKAVYWDCVLPFEAPGRYLPCGIGLGVAVCPYQLSEQTLALALTVSPSPTCRIRSRGSASSVARIFEISYQIPFCDFAFKGFAKPNHAIVLSAHSRHNPQQCSTRRLFIGPTNAKSPIQRMIGRGEATERT